MKKMKRTIYILSVLFVSLVLLLGFSSSAASNALIDKIGVLDADDRERISEATEVFEANTGYKLRFYIYDKTSAIYHGSYGYDGESYLYQYGYSEQTDLVLLIISRERVSSSYEWRYDLYTYGNAQKSIRDKEVGYLLDAPSVYDNLKSGRIAEGILAFASVAEDAVLENIVPLGTRMLPPLILAAVAAVIVCVSVFIYYKKKSRSEAYPLREFTNLSLTCNTDTYLSRHVNRVYSPRQRRTGGARGGRGGGGGGHRGGR